MKIDRRVTSLYVSDLLVKLAPKADNTLAEGKQRHSHTYIIVNVYTNTRSMLTCCFKRKYTVEYKLQCSVSMILVTNVWSKHCYGVLLYTKFIFFVDET